MNKVLFVLLSLYAPPTADLLAAEVTKATPEQQSTLDLPVEVLDATSMYAKAFKSGDRSFHNAMKELRTAQDVLDSTIQKLTDADGSKRIHLPNDIPSFLRASVIDKTSDVYDMIDRMSLNSHIKEHMKHSVGYYYEVPEDNCATDLEQVILADLQAMAKQYRVLGVIEKNATLNGVQFIVIPDVGNTDSAITSRTIDP